MRPLLVASAAAIATCVPLAACGSPDDEGAVRTTVERLGRATAEKNYGVLCRDVLSKQLVARVRAVGLPCEEALGRGLGGVRAPKLTIRKVKLDGDAALVQVTSTAVGQPSSTDVLRLVKEDGKWRISSLSGAQPPAPQRHP